MFAAETFGVMPDVLCIGQGAERRLRPAVGDDLPASRSPTPSGARSTRTPASSRGTPSRATRSPAPPASPCCARSSSATCAATPACRASASRPASSELADEVRRHRRHPRQGAVPGRSSSSSDLATKEPFPAEMAFGVQVGRRALENGLLCRFDPHWIAFGPPLVVDGRADRRDGGDPRPEHRARCSMRWRPECARE